MQTFGLTAKVVCSVWPSAQRYNVRYVLPLLAKALDTYGILDLYTYSIAIATICVDTAAFWPEQKQGDTSAYASRGFVPCTGKEEYAVLARQMLVHELYYMPDLLLCPEYAVLALAIKFKTQGIAYPASCCNWARCRLLIAGDQHSKLIDFSRIATALIHKGKKPGASKHSPLLQL